MCPALRRHPHDLALIEPFGFKLDDKQLKRAGMDYWNHVRWNRWADWNAFRASLQARRDLAHRVKRPKAIYRGEYRAEDYLVFGRETAGLPKLLLDENHDHWLRIPMFNREARSLNLSNCVAIVLFEALRRHGFNGELPFDSH